MTFEKIHEMEKVLQNLQLKVKIYFALVIYNILTNDEIAAIKYEISLGCCKHFSASFIPFLNFLIFLRTPF